VNRAARPEYRLFLDDAEVHVQNFSNQLTEGTAAAKVTGQFMGSGQTVVGASFRPEPNGGGHPETPRPRPDKAAGRGVLPWPGVAGGYAPAAVVALPRLRPTSRPIPSPIPTAISTDAAG
jgi:hypothetical protein